MFCEVYLLDVPYHLDRPFDYECSDETEVGTIVKVPFGKADKLRYGVITKVKSIATKPLTPASELIKSITTMKIDG